mgnify:CR=1 FL=1
MDWSKAKSILVVALIITNALLGIVLFQSERNVDTTLKKEFIEETVRLLENKDIKVDTDIPRKNPKLATLTVEYENVEPGIVNRNFFNDKGNISFKDKDEVLIDISYNDELITILNKKHLIYESKSNNDNFDIKDEKDAVYIALNFLKSKNYSTSDMKVSFVKLVDDVYNIEFTKLYKDYFLESSFTNIQVGSKGIIKMERQWLNMIDASENPKSISSAPKSLLGLLSMEEVYGKTIKDISICYYFDPKKHAYIDNPEEAQQGRAIPAWRIQFDDGDKVFIDSYN